MRMFTAMLVAWLLATPVRGEAAAGEVVDRSSNGFTVKVVVEVAAPPETVYTSLVRHVGDWWDPAHTFSGDSRNLSIVAEPGGCFCERQAGGGAQHGRVVNVVSGKLLRIVGALGPLQQTGVTGVMTWQMEKSGSRASTLTFTYAVGGYYPGGLDALAAPVDGVLTRQVQLLKEYSEKAARN